MAEGDKAEEIVKEKKKILLDAIIKNRKDLMTKGSELLGLKVERVPSGIFIFDMLTGGGIPEGRWTEFYGAKSSSKSTLSYKIINSYLKKHPGKKVLYVDFEHTFEPAWASRFIENMDRVVVADPDYGEEGVDLMQDAITAEDCGMVVIDSLAEMSPIGISELPAIKDTRGLHPKLVVKMFRKLGPMTNFRKRNGNQLTYLVINQTTASMATSTFAPQVLKPGGQKKEFMYSLDVRLYYTGNKEIGGIPAIWNYEFNLDKNKLGLAKRSGAFSMIQMDCSKGRIGDVLEHDEVLAYAKKVGLISKEGKFWKVKHFPEGFKNLEEMKAALVSMPENFSQLKSETLKLCIDNLTVIQEEQPDVAVNSEVQEAL